MVTVAKGKAAEAQRKAEAQRVAFMGPVLETWQVAEFTGKSDDVLSNDYTITSMAGAIVAGGLTLQTARHMVELHNRWLEMEVV